ncbi:Multiple C2 and transmembrane domain-containing protein 1 [Eumeta japonica]|uniref:Multiple C2 and transmembrane domain-containing protein 1 n=1 Tax=Eumeta variegata TaxID=151549 RepID=A0A4C1ZMS8_EUMVA|nr:Multiple C2 and transmembrane domain-containing protein 1 [Eumeta japonica]
MDDNNKRRNWNLSTRKHATPNAIRNVNVVNSSRSVLPRSKSSLDIEKINEESSLLAAVSTEVLDSIGKKDNNKFEKFVSNLGDIVKRPERMNVTVVVVEAKNLPDAPEDGGVHGVYCKFSLGNDTFKTKIVPKSYHPQWKEIFNFTHLKDSELNISIWDKGKDKYFMGSCVINLTNLETEKTHDIWQPLDDEFGSLHLLITVCGTRRGATRMNTSFDKIKDAETKYVKKIYKETIVIEVAVFEKNSLEPEHVNSRNISLATADGRIPASSFNIIQSM